jgi:hypothetical protein
MNGYETYKCYIALKNHFNSDTYDYFRYHGKTRANKATFQKRNDKYFFEKVSQHKDPVKYILANIIEQGPDIWVGDIASEQQSETNYNKWLGRQQSLTYVFKQDVERITDPLNDNIIVSDSQHPPLLKLYIHKTISIETLIILNDLCKFFGHWNKSIEDTIVWPSVYKTCKKYRPFLNFDKNKFKQIVIDRFSDVE